MPKEHRYQFISVPFLPKLYPWAWSQGGSETETGRGERDNARKKGANPLLLPFLAAEPQGDIGQDAVMGRGPVLTLNEFGVLLLY